MIFNLPGFPTEISERIEAPDFSELLQYPFFNHADPDAVRKYGSEWQKKLVDAVPWRHDKKYCSVKMQVHIQMPNYRTLTHGGTFESYHIDGSQKDEIGYFEATERQHFYQTDCQSLTEYNLNPIVVDTGEDKRLTMNEMIHYLNVNANKLGVIPKKVPGSKIITFHNELHRPTFPDKMEFRFVMHARETDWIEPGQTGPESVSNAVYGWDCNFMKEFKQIQKNDDGSIQIFMPTGFKL